MKWSKQDPYLKAGVTVFVTGTALMCVYRLFHSVDNLWMSIQHTIGAFFSMMTPFIIAVVIAYLLKPVRDFITKGFKRLFPKVRIGKIRAAALTLTMLLFLAAVGTAIGLLIPAIWKNLLDLIYQLPQYFTEAEATLHELVQSIPWLGNFNLDMEQLETQLLAWLQGIVDSSNLGQMAGQVAGQVVATVGGVFSALLTFVLSLVLSIYILKSGRQLLASVKDVMIRQWGETRTQRIVSLFRDIDQVFGQYIGGKMMQSFIMFLMILPLFLLLGVAYAPLMAAIVALSNLIPYIGPFIGGAVPVFFMLLIHPVKALLVLGAVLLVQQIDNYLVEPRLIGDRMGMHPFWVISCVIIGGELLGVFGILLAIPIAGVLRITAKRYYDARDARKKKKQAEDGDHT